MRNRRFHHSSTVPDDDVFITGPGRRQWLMNMEAGIRRLSRNGLDTDAEKHLIRGLDGALMPRGAAQAMVMPLDAWLYFRARGGMGDDDQRRMVAVAIELVAMGGDMFRGRAPSISGIALAQSRT